MKTPHPYSTYILKYSDDDESKQRIFKNTLLFITAKRDDIRELKNLVKNFLAWNSIMNVMSYTVKSVTLKGTRLDHDQEKS